MSIPHRSLDSPMLLSHIALIIPCVWWLFGKNRGDYFSHVIDKFMASMLTVAIVLSYLYHFYYESVLYFAEETYMYFAVLILNAYLIYRGVSGYVIAAGILMLLLLKYSVDFCQRTRVGQSAYEILHPYCHYIGGFYVLYCVYFIQKSFTHLNK